jgi:hypothetical protein
MSPVCWVRVSFFDFDLVLDVPFAAAGPALRALYARGATNHHHHPNPDADDHHHEPPATVVMPTLEDHLSWLWEAGFAEVDCVWKRFSEVFLCGFHSSQRPDR